MNTYLKPLIKDLKYLWTGVEINLPNGTKLCVPLCSVLDVTYLLAKVMWVQRIWFI